jgi:hypothetical protein
MFEKLAALKVNFALVFLGAPLIILLIKASSMLLPPKYYFSFSRLVVGASEPFIVDPPGVTARKLCEVMERRTIPRETYRNLKYCTDDYEFSVSREDLDRIYGVALTSDPSIRKAFRDTAAQIPIQQLSDADVKRIAAESPSVGRAIEAIIDYYSNELAKLRRGPSSDDAIAVLYKRGTGGEPGEEPEQPEQPAKKGSLSDDVINHIVQAHESFRAELTSANLAKRIVPIKKSAIDEMIQKSEGTGNIGFKIAQYYTDQLNDGVEETISLGFARFGFENERKTIFDEINNFSWKNYLLSVLLRLTPVFLFGLLAGMLAGREELFSISLAGGLAAFLLSWPLMLMWERLVQSSWTDKRTLFFTFYAVYIVSFYLTARSAGMLGAWLREQKIAVVPDPSGLARGAAIRVKWREVAISIALAAVINGIVYSWNVFIPLAGAAQ